MMELTHEQEMKDGVITRDYWRVVKRYGKSTTISDSLHLSAVEMLELKKLIDEKFR